MWRYQVWMIVSGRFENRLKLDRKHKFVVVIITLEVFRVCRNWCPLGLTTHTLEHLQTRAQISIIPRTYPHTYWDVCSTVSNSATSTPHSDHPRWTSSIRKREEIDGHFICAVRTYREIYETLLHTHIMPYLRWIRVRKRPLSLRLIKRKSLGEPTTHITSAKLADVMCRGAWCVSEASFTSFGQPATISRGCGELPEST